MPQNSTAHTQLTIPDIQPANRGAQSVDVWGFEDTALQFNRRGLVEMTGARYNGLSGHELPNLRAWFEDKTQVPLDPNDDNKSIYPPLIPPSGMTPLTMARIGSLFDEHQYSIEPEVRLRHSHGHTQAEMYAIKYGQVDYVADLVVFPESDEQIAALVALCVSDNMMLIPYGGGTNVTSALQRPRDDQRQTIVVSLAQMNQVLWIDTVNGQAKVQAGAVGADLQSVLASAGFTLGHEPDSLEFSTLGGWIATKASGMKKNRYGNIEDLVIDMTVISPLGKITRTNPHQRESTGMDPRALIFGSEGSLGIVTAAVVKVSPLPLVQQYGSVLFHNFADGVGFMQDLAKTRVWPASARLVDNTQFQLGMVLKPESRGLAAIKSKIEKWLVTTFGGYKPDDMVACTLVYEGSRDEVELQKKTISALARQHGGFAAGAANGERGYKVTFGIGYIRDFCMRYWYLGESFETTVPWSQALEVCDRVKARLYAECEQRNIPGRPFVSCRVTQLYETGCCVYFYFAYYYKGIDNPSALYHELESAARDEILECGGSLSHHHGIGKLRQDMLKNIMSEASLQFIAQTKLAVDPMNIFGVGNLPQVAANRQHE